MEDGVRVDSHWQRRGGLGTMLPLACSVGWAPAPPAPKLPGLVNSHESWISPLMFQARTWWPRPWACLCPKAGASQADPDPEQHKALRVTAAEQAPGHWHSLSFWGLRGRQLSSPSHTPPDPRRKQRDNDTWPVFSPFSLGIACPPLSVGCLESLFCPVSGRGMAPRERQSGLELLGGCPWLQVPGHGLINLRRSMGVGAKPPEPCHSS